MDTTNTTWKPNLLERVINGVDAVIARKIENPLLKNVVRYTTAGVAAAVVMNAFVWGTFLLATLARDYLGIGAL